MQDEFYAITFRKKLYTDLVQLQIDLDEWLVYYNQERPHSGRYCYGRTPMQTFVESITLAKKKTARPGDDSSLILLIQPLLITKRKILSCPIKF
jgi:hypothetical protein